MVEDMLGVALNIYVGIVLIIASVLDIKEGEISLRFLILTIMPLPAVMLLCGVNVISLSKVYGMLVGAVVLFISLISRNAIGAGDALMIMWLGYALGVFPLLELLGYAWAACFLAAIVVYVKKKKSIPFIPFLGIGYVFMFIYRVI